MNTRVSTTEAIVAEASAWFIEFRSGDATAETRMRFDEWLRRSPQHIQAYLGDRVRVVGAAHGGSERADRSGCTDRAGAQQRG